MYNNWTNVQQPYKKGTKKVKQRSTNIQQKYNKGSTKVQQRYKLRTKDNEGMRKVRQWYDKGTTSKW